MPARVHYPVLKPRVRAQDTPHRKHRSARPRGTPGHQVAAREPKSMPHATPPRKEAKHKHPILSAASRRPRPPEREAKQERRYYSRLHRKEVIQPHLPVRLPCYDLVPITSLTLDGSHPRGEGPPASGAADFHDLTGGVYKARERIHRGVADPRLLATPPSRSRVAGSDPN